MAKRRTESADSLISSLNSDPSEDLDFGPEDARRLLDERNQEQGGNYGAAEDESCVKLLQREAEIAGCTSAASKNNFVARMAQATLEKMEKEKSAMVDGLQPFYDGPYQFTGSLSGELWIADLLLVIFLYISAERSSLFGAGLVCRAWAERIALVPQWRFTPLRSGNKSPAAKTWLAKQSTAQLKLVSTYASETVYRDGYLAKCKMEAVSLELWERENREREKQRRRFVLGVPPCYVLYFLLLVSACWAIAYGLGILHIPGLTNQLEVGMAAFWITTLLLLVVLFATVFRFQSERRWRRNRVLAAMNGPWISTACASLPIVIIGCLLFALMAFRITVLEDVVKTPTFDLNSTCTTSTTQEQGGQADFPYVYRVHAGSDVTQVGGHSDPYTPFGLFYNRSQQIFNLNGTNFTLLTSSQQRVGTTSGNITTCEGGTCSCSIAIVGGVQDEDWWMNLASSRSELRLRSFRKSLFVASPSAGVYDQSVEATSQFLWRQYRVPLVSASGAATEIELPTAQLSKWQRTFKTTCIVFAVILAAVCVGLLVVSVLALTDRSGSCEQYWLQFWLLIAGVCLNGISLTVWGGLCYFGPAVGTGQPGDPLHTEILPDYCLMSRWSALFMFSTGLGTLWFTLLYFVVRCFKKAC